MKCKEDSNLSFGALCSNWIYHLLYGAHVLEVLDLLISSIPIRHLFISPSSLARQQHQLEVQDQESMQANLLYTGPTRPSDAPPRLGSDSADLIHLMIDSFSSGVIVLSLNTGIDCGPVTIAS
jgi:hypothetical protein